MGCCSGSKLEDKEKEHERKEREKKEKERREKEKKAAEKKADEGVANLFDSKEEMRKDRDKVHSDEGEDSDSKRKA